MNTVLTGVLTLICFISGLVFILCVVTVRKLWREVVQFITPPAENEPSALALLFAQLAHQGGQAIAMEIKTTFMGKESGMKRGEQALAGDVLTDVVGAQSPIMGAILDGFPTLKKRILKNPGLVGAALNLVGGMAKSGTVGKGPAGGGGAGNHQSAFHI